MAVVAIANTSTYIQGGIEYSAYVSGSSIVVDVKLYYRRTNSWSGGTYSSNTSMYVCISGDPDNYGYSGSGAITVNGGQQNVWQGPFFTASRTFDASRSGDTIYVGWKSTDNIDSYFSGGNVNVSITLPTAYTKPNTPTISASRGAGKNSITYGTTSFNTPSTGTVYLYGGTSSTPTTQIASKTTTGNSTYSHTGLSAGTTYYYRARAYNGQLWSNYSSVVSAKTYTAPTKPTISISSKTVNSVAVTYGTTSFGDPNSGTIHLYGGTSASPTSSIASKTSTGNSTYTWSSRAANTKYYFRSRATNTKIWSSYTSDVSTVTLPAAATVSVSSYNKTSITIAWSTAADGGAYNKSIQYSLDGGTTWTNGKTGITGSASSGTFTISSLTAGTSYTIKTRTTTTAGSTTGSTLTQKTRQSATVPTISKNDAQQTYNKITYGTTSFGYPNAGTVYLYGGTSASPTTQINSKTTTGNTTFQHSSLTGNTKYYYRSRAKNNGLNEYTNYTSNLEIITRPPTPTFAVSSYTSTTITLSYSCPADGGALNKQLQYSINGQSSWRSGATVSTGSASTGTFTITGLTPDTTYTIYTKVYVGGTPTSVSGNTITQKTDLSRKMYGSVNGETKLITKLYGSTYGLDVLPKTFEGTTTPYGITYTLNGRTLTLNGQNDGTGNSVYYLARIGTQPLDLPSGTYRSLPSNTNVHMTFYDGSRYQQLNSFNNYTTTFDSAGSYSLYVEVNKGDRSVFDNFEYTPVLYDDTGHAIEISKLYGSVNGQTKLVY